MKSRGFAAAAEGCRGSRGPPDPERRGFGVSRAARVSQGSVESHGWAGLGSLRQWERDAEAGPTITLTFYYTVRGGVPTEADVHAAINDMEQLHARLATGGRLQDLTATGVMDTSAVTWAAPPVKAGFPAYP